MLTAYRKKMHGMCDKKILRSCFNELEKASYNGLVLIWFYYLFQIPGVNGTTLLVSLFTFTFSITGTLSLVIFKELLSIWQDDTELLHSESGGRSTISPTSEGALIRCLSTNFIRILHIQECD